ncbi:MAG TPA: type II toxin-antitoxin system RelE/ParE family toxin, partial [Phenylobacterium sp.]|nr:type II toxin-antitoxin system RelE/ParE family toxin [Phenylobacterium sp.]
WCRMSGDEQTPKIPLVFFKSTTGNEPVRDWLKAMDRDDRLEIGGDLQRVQYRWPVGMPLCRALKGGLWEVRTNLASKKISRVLICFHDGVLFALHGFIKKTQKTPDEDLAIARKRMKEVEDDK